MSPIVNIREFFHLGCSRGKQLEGNYVAGGEDSLRNKFISTSLTATALAVPLVIHNMCGSTQWTYY